MLIHNGYCRVFLVGLIMSKNKSSFKQSKKWIVVALIVFSIGSAWGTVFSGEGTSESPYLISTIDDLNQLAINVKNGETYENKYLKLENDIVFPEGSNQSLAPIGESTHPFMGNFDGSKHTIFNMLVTSSTDYTGLFGVIEKASILNISFVNSQTKGNAYVGTLCGLAKSSLIGYISNNGYVEGNRLVGGLCGAIEDSSEIYHSTNSGIVKGKISVGGICGYMLRSTITNNSNNANVLNITLSDGYYPVDTIQIEDANSSSSTQTIASSSSSNPLNTIITSSSSSDKTIWELDSSLLISSSSYVAVAISSNSNSPIAIGSSSSSSIAFEVDTNSFFGGICGYATNVSLITNSTNSGMINSNEIVGGICGKLSGSTISNCLNMGRVVATSITKAGAVYAYAENSTIEDNYYDKQMCPIAILHSEITISNGGVTGLLTSEMIQLYVNDNNWSKTTNMYPIPRWIKDDTIAIVAATPIFLADSETVDNVISNFTFNATDNVIWTSQDKISINGNEAQLIKKGNDVLTGSLGSVNKQILLTIKALLPNITSSIDVPAILWCGEVLLPTVPDIDYLGENLGGVWQLSATEDFVQVDTFSVLTTVKYDQDGYYLRYAATNENGVSYSNVVQITVKTKLTHNISIDATKVYDGTNKVNYTGNLTNVRDSDEVTLEAEFAYNSKHVAEANSINVVTWEISGADADRYVLLDTLHLDSHTASITPKEVIVSGIMAEDKVYDGKKTATLDYSEMVIEGVISGEHISANATGQFEDAEVGKNKVVTISEITLVDGTDNSLASDYALASEGQQTSTKATITKATSIADNTLQSKSTLYPNITTTGFYVDFGDNQSAISIYDHQGRIMDMVHVNGRQFIDISRYAQGLYIVKTNMSKTWKVIKY